MKVKIYGAGSIGNHLTQAARRMGWDVCVVDADPQALERMKNEIYPTRYGAWDDAIQQYTSDTQPKGGFDIIAIGTPPHVRMPLAIEALAEQPRVLLLEKPLTFPFDPSLRTFVENYTSQSSTIALLGYDHAIGESIERVAGLLESKSVGKVQTIDVEFREHWKGIFSAHPWLSGPADTYLGYWKKGGGASGEHSHALHLWQYLAQKAEFGTWTDVAGVFKIEKEGEAEFDSIATFTFTTDRGNVGRVVQDVITLPVRKWARIQGVNGFIEWYCNGVPEGDLIRYQLGTDEVKEEIFAKKRPDDFYREMQHVEAVLSGSILATESPISFASGLDVMKVLESVWNKEGRTSTPIESI